jgi:LPXTG-motif cell wall-anchored protein
MKHWLVLLAVYAVVAVLVLPGSLLASQDPGTPAATGDETTGPAPEAVEEGVEKQAAGEEAEPPAETTVTPEAESTAPAGEPEAEPEQPAAKAAPPEPAPAEPAPAEPAADEAEKDQAAKAAKLDEAGRGTKAKKSKKTKKAKAAATANVTISDFRFTPATVTVVEGDTVTWTNDGPTGHSATASNGEFDTGIFPAGQSRSESFDTPGTYAYICTPHPNMEGTVVVEAAGSDPAGEEEDAQLENDEEALDEDLEADFDSGGLPNTGRDERTMIILGLVMIAIGSFLSLRTRRQS